MVGVHTCKRIGVCHAAAEYCNMTLFISKDSGMTAMIRCAGVGDHRDGGKRGLTDHTCLRVTQGEKRGRRENEDDLYMRRMRL